MAKGRKKSIVRKKENLSSQEASSATADWGALSRYTFYKTANLILSARSPFVVLAFFVVANTSQLLYLCLLPEAKRADANAPLMVTTEAIKAILANHLVSNMGWVLFVLELLLFLVVVSIMWKRIQNQGNLLKTYRQQADKDRVSSRNVDSLELHEEKMKTRFGDT